MVNACMLVLIADYLTQYIDTEYFSQSRMSPVDSTSEAQSLNER